MVELIRDNTVLILSSHSYVDVSVHVRSLRCNCESEKAARRHRSRSCKCLENCTPSCGCNGRCFSGASPLQHTVNSLVPPRREEEKRSGGERDGGGGWSQQSISKAGCVLDVTGSVTQATEHTIVCVCPGTGLPWGKRREAAVGKLKNGVGASGRNGRDAGGGSANIHGSNLSPRISSEMAEPTAVMENGGVRTRRRYETKRRRFCGS